MKNLRVAHGIVPIGEFKARAATYLRRLAENGEPLVLTQNGRPAAVVLSPAEFDSLHERQRLLESIAAGLADAEAGRVADTEDVRRRIGARRGDRAR